MHSVTAALSKHHGWNRNPAEVQSLSARELAADGPSLWPARLRHGSWRLDHASTLILQFSVFGARAWSLGPRMQGYELQSKG